MYRALDETKNEVRRLVVYSIVNPEGKGRRKDVVYELRARGHGSVRTGYFSNNENFRNF